MNSSAAINPSAEGPLMNLAINSYSPIGDLTSAYPCGDSHTFGRKAPLKRPARLGVWRLKAAPCRHCAALGRFAHAERGVSRGANVLRIPLFSLAVLAAMSSTAQEPASVSAETYIKATPIERSAPSFPADALAQGQEGWVMVSFIVSPTGEVEEPMIEDSSGVASLDRAALQAVRKWRYSAALRNGTPVEQSMTKTRIVFQLEGGRKGASPQFVKKYRAVAELIDKGEFANVPALLDEMESGGRVNLYEDSFFWWLKYIYLEKSKSTDTKQMIDALRASIGYEEDYLPADQFVAAAARLYALEVKTGDLSRARSTFARLRDSKAARRSKQHAPTLEALTPSYMEIERLVAGNTVLVSPGEIGSHDYWVHDLLRRSFSLGNIKGRVDVVDVRCERGTKRYDSFPIDAVWQVPESWGPCGVYIKGEPGTTFAFEDRPEQSLQHTPPTDEKEGRK
jgi:TonB family protein